MSEFDGHAAREPRVSHDADLRRGDRDRPTVSIRIAGLVDLRRDARRTVALRGRGRVAQPRSRCEPATHVCDRSLNAVAIDPSGQ